MEHEDMIREAIEGFENFPLTETQQYLVNYLRDNLQDIALSME